MTRPKWCIVQLGEALFKDMMFELPGGGATRVYYMADTVRVRSKQLVKELSESDTERKKK